MLPCFHKRRHCFAFACNKSRSEAWHTIIVFTHVTKILAVILVDQNCKQTMLCAGLRALLDSRLWKQLWKQKHVR